MFDRTHLARVVVFSGVFVFTPAAGVPVALAQCEVAKLTASDAAKDDDFGRQVSVSGDAALIGVWFDDDAGSGSGSAYVYRYDGSKWVQEAKLAASDAEEQDKFGTSVSIWSDLALIGAYDNDDGGFCSGSAYVFRFDGRNWKEGTKLTSSDAQGAVRAFGQTYEIALRLHRGEAFHGED